MKLARHIALTLTLALTLALVGCGQTVVEDLDAILQGDSLEEDTAEDTGEAAGDTAGDATGDTADTSGQTTDTQSGDAGDAGDAATDTGVDAGPTCKSASDCDKATPFCLLPAGTCAACKYAQHCPGPHGRCLEGACLAPKPCNSDKDCAADDGICDPATKHCADCQNHDDCAKGEVCKLGQCLPSPKDCKSSKDCSALGQVCTGDDICADCESGSDCSDGSYCLQGLCVPGVCKPGETVCDGPIKRKVCKGDGSGYLEDTCASGQGCADGICKKQLCNPGQAKCDGDTPATCADNGLTWQPGTACKTGESCVDGKCLAKVCDKGDTGCTPEGALKVCAADEKSWKTVPCDAGLSCKGGKCVPQICKPNTNFCDGEKVMACDKLGLGSSLVKDCATASTICAEAKCAPPSCTKGDTLCKGDAEAVCKADGSGWEVKACTDLDSNKCTPEACDVKVHKCASGPSKPCDDGNPCTTGSCNGFTGDCSQAPKTGACDDKDACTSGDTCVSGLCLSGPGTVDTVAGSSGGYLDGPGKSARFNQPWGLSAGPGGVVYIADRYNNRIRKMDAAGIVTTVAGSGSGTFGDGVGTKAHFRRPRDLAAGPAGWIYVADTDNHRLRAVSPNGVVSSIAGTGSAADKDGVVAVAQLYLPDSVTLGAAGAIWFGESSRHKLRLLQGGKVSTPVGTTAGFADGPAASAKLNTPMDVEVGPKGLIWFADYGNKRIRTYDPTTKTVKTQLGDGKGGYVDGPVAKAAIQSVSAMAFDNAGRLWFYDFNNRLLRRLEPGVSVVTIAGQQGKPGIADGDPAKATFNDLRRLVFDTNGAVIMADISYNRLRRIASTTVVCDDGSPCTIDACDKAKGTCTYQPAKAGSACSDGSACTTADACDAKGACVGKAKACSDGNSCTHDDCEPFSGTCSNTAAPLACDDGDACTPGDVCVAGTCKADVGRVDTIIGGNATDAVFGKASAGGLLDPVGIARTKAGDLVVAERGGHRIRKVTLAGASSVVAGDGQAGYVDGPGAKARFSSPEGVAVDPFGTVYVADTNNHRIRKISPQGVVTTLAGSGGKGLGDGKGTSAQFQGPTDLDVDAKGAVYVADTLNHAIRKITTDGTVTTLAGDGTPGFSDGKGKFVRMNQPRGVVALPDGGVLFGDRSNNRLRRIAADGTVTTWAGMGSSASYEGHRLSATTPYPRGLARAPDGSIWVQSDSNAGLRVIDPTGQLHVVVPANGGYADGAANTARFNGASGVVAISGNEAWIADRHNSRVRRALRALVTCHGSTPCAPNTCNPKTGICAVKKTADGGACDPATCTVAGSCKAGKCEGGKPNACDDKDACTVDSCDPKLGCQHTLDATKSGCCKPDVWSDGFEKGLVGYSSDPTNQGVQWQAWTPKDTKLPAEGKALIKLGKPGEEKMNKLSGSYLYNYLTGPKFTIPNGVQTTVSLKVRFDVSSTSSTTRAYFYLRRANGQQFSIGTRYPNTKDWQTLTYDVTALGGETVELRIRGRLYGPYAVGHGILIDDVKVTSTCKAKACTSSGQCQSLLGCNKGTCTEKVCVYKNTCCKGADACDDGKPCTLDSCGSSGCQHSNVGGCCNSDKDDASKLCNDNNPCTADVCPKGGGACLHNAIAACCLSDIDCDDDKPCTIDTCTATNTCNHKDICCTKDKDCDDGDAKCTTDKCVDGKCQYTFAQVAGCCQPLIGPWHFDDAKQWTGWTVQTCTPSSGYWLPTNCKAATPGAGWKGWQLRNPAPVHQSPKGALYYGDPAKNNFAWGASAQVARSPAMKVQPGKSTLKFKVWWDTEGGTTYDKLVALLWVDGKRLLTKNATPSALQGWYKGSSGHTKAKTWAEASIDVSKYTGKNVQVELYFNSGDSAGNSGQGVYIDDLRLVSDCK